MWPYKTIQWVTECTACIPYKTWQLYGFVWWINFLINCLKSRRVINGGIPGFHNSIFFLDNIKYLHYSKKLKEHFDSMIFIERYPLKRCQGCVKLIASKVNCFLNINDLSEVQLCMSSNSWTWECPHTKDGADHVPWIFLSSVDSNKKYNLGNFSVMSFL